MLINTMNALYVSSLFRLFKKRQNFLNVRLLRVFLLNFCKRIGKAFIKRRNKLYLYVLLSFGVIVNCGNDTVHSCIYSQAFAAVGIVKVTHVLPT